MKVSIVLSLVFAVHVSASVYAQSAKISLNFEGTALGDVLSQIEKETEFVFFYRHGTIDNNLKVNVHAKDQNINTVLQEVFRGTGIEYSIKDRLIILGQKGADETQMIQQGIRITGTVTDNGVAMPGVNVVVKGTTVGVITDIDGRYTITVPDKNSVLLFSFIGYTTSEITVGDQTNINVALDEDTREIEEVVVVGYGVQRRSDLTGAVGSVKSEDIVRANPTQPAKALQGQVSGMNITKADSRPGSEYKIDIRGLSSMNYSNEPLVVIDGVMGGKMSTLNPSDIEKIDVLKDASATAIYGSRGANGVIIITTKKGIQGKTRVDYDGYVGVKVPAHIPEMMNAQKFYQTYTDVVVQDGGKAATFTDSEKAMVDSGNSTDWVDEITDPALQTSHVVAISGGNEKTTHYFSAGYLNEKGNIIQTAFEKYNLKGSIDSRLNNVVKVGFTSYYTYSIQHLGSGEAIRGAFRARPTGTVHYNDLQQADVARDRDWNGYAVWMGINDAQVMSPIVEADSENYQDETRVSSFLGNIYLELEPIKNLTLRSALSVSTFNSRNGYFAGPYTKTRNFKDPEASNSFSVNGSYTWDNILTYKLKTGKNDLTLTGVTSAMKDRVETSGTSVQNLPYDSEWYALGTASSITEVSSRIIERTLLSYMGRINYSFDNKYLITLTGRADGSSVLAPGHKWDFFPSAAIAWRAGEEDFIKHLDIFSDLKVRLSYGVVGNDVVPPYKTQSLMGRTVYDFNAAPAYGFASKSLGNKDLSWEKSREINFGLNMGFLRNRIILDAEFYNRKTDGLIQEVKLPTSTGYSAATANVGKLLNRGLELTLNTVNFQGKDFRWTTSINFSTNHNEIVELYGGTVTRDIDNKLFVGESLKSHYYYKFDGIWQTAEAETAKKYGQVPGSVKVVDRVNKDANSPKISSNVDEDDRTVLGNELPSWLGGMTNSLYYKDFDFSFFVYTRQGVMFRNAMLQGTMGELGSNRYNRLNLNYWTTTNPTNDYFGVAASNPYREAIQYQDASFWRISDITLGYSLPQSILSKIKFNRVRAYVQVSNPFVFTDFISMDPEYNSSAYKDDVPSVIFLFGLNISL